jgi:drug/metabolite transporter (DMT)-like permease
LNEQKVQVRVAVLTAMAMTAFAANSVLCRMALGARVIDASGFTAIRLLSGGVTLGILTLSLRNYRGLASGSWLSGFLLFLYAAMFSCAYLSLSAGTGSLILFGSVQMTMIISGLRSGERPHVLQWAGLLFALGGLAYLVSPGIAAPSLIGSFLMGGAGVAWGFYSLRGRGVKDPISETAGNFIRAAPFGIVLSALMIRDAHGGSRGILLAILSGALASGIGYVIWYSAVRGLSSTRAATVQLSVPVLAAFAGVIFLAEVVTLRLVVSSVLILGGVALTVMAKERLKTGRM